MMSPEWRSTISPRRLAGKVATPVSPRRELLISGASDEPKMTRKSLSASCSHWRLTERTRTVHSTILPWCLRRNSSFCSSVRLVSLATRITSANVTGDEGMGVTKGEGVAALSGEDSAAWERWEDASAGLGGDDFWCVGRWRQMNWPTKTSSTTPQPENIHSLLRCRYLIMKGNQRTKPPGLRKCVQKSLMDIVAASFASRQSETILARSSRRERHLASSEGVCRNVVHPLVQARFE